ncbi:SUMO deconjugating cysteine peptidase Ulp2 [Ectocarpus siliculosus]|uniref:SUMO deconjugating cysteine peptidase Ulp2 n=1 Tax=Ectocarpus siliculosus TaxID=2880 RepID=D7FP60_ECTSI|nr:SUMO deconjugating cysteine peptidase Ulp2 [Ectocarpus siliculosus]|eukprot:CBJ34276.1 SUMO deconjugating cysteine peptidase Ulp2 [Ectocarpus siliculosus]
MGAFYAKLSNRSFSDFDAAYSSVQRWYGGVNIFTKKFVLVPVVEDLHWSLSCLCNLDQLQTRVGECG